MNQQHLESYAQMPQPEGGVTRFVENLKQPMPEFFAPDEFFFGSVEIHREFSGAESAFTSLRRVLAAKGISEKPGALKLRFLRDPALSGEEFIVRCAPEGAEIFASDPDGMRRAVYFLEDRIREAPGTLFTYGEWRKKPFVKDRISRCFFGPTCRPPFFVDELTNDVDYYPEEYLNKLAHDGVNGLWLTMNFRDLESSVFPGRGALEARRFAKLRTTVERCARYGIRIYLFFSEPKGFGDAHYRIPESEAKNHPELLGVHNQFCTSTEAGRRYLEESVERVFKNVPGLGGMINIMYGEDNGCCLNGFGDPQIKEVCPACARREPRKVYREMAEIMCRAMKKYAPESVFIGWFYAPECREDSALSKYLLEIAETFPEDCCFMLNFESGGIAQQLGRPRTVFDYSLAFPGPSRLFADASKICASPGAKLQVGCSHEDAAVPFIPVPSNLFEKYKFLHSAGVGSVMQCWYFGNYPGLMNRAAGELSFEPFPENEEEFLLRLAAPFWRRDAARVAEAWKLFAEGYRKFPANICFEWYGPLHNAIAWPLHLFPVDKPIAPSWILKNFPEVSGDRIGECLGFQHTLEEAIELCSQMDRLWSGGCAILEELRPYYAENQSRIEDIRIAFAIELQIRSALNMLRFYSLREEMFYEKRDNLAAMRDLVLEEISNTEKMKALCESDPRLGYHSEAEAFLFYPDKLAGRIGLLKELLEQDFPRFRLDAPFIDRYTGAMVSGLFARLNEFHPIGASGSAWKAVIEGENLFFEITGRMPESEYIIELEPCRLWTPMWFVLQKDDVLNFSSFICAEVPNVRAEFTPDRIRVGMPLAFFDGFRRRGFPMRMNVRRGADAWGGSHPWPFRLTHRDYNPADSGWLELDSFGPV